MAIHDGPDHRYLFVSPSYERLARSRGPFLGKTFSEVSAEAEEVMVPLLDRVEPRKISSRRPISFSR